MINQFKYIVSFLLLCCSFGAQAQGVEGYVKTAESGKPIEGAQVFVLNGKQSAITDKNGYYSMKLTSGDYQIGVFYFERKSMLKEVSVEEVVELLDFSMPLLETVLEEVITSGNKEDNKDIDRLNAVEGNKIYEGKKNELIKLEKLNGNLATNSARQVFAKVPGLNIWESDAAGLQLGIGGRGLDPNRTSNFNTRQNGYDISADPLGYPESYYTPPMEALARIEVVRGAASLQYGTQFGGMVNFVFKEGPEKKKFEYTTRNTIGSFGLISSYNSVGGSSEKVDYFAYFQHKRGDGWRVNESFKANSGFANATIHLSSKLDLAVEFTHMDYLAQQPGGLTYNMFVTDPRQSRRERNWFEVKWNIPAISLDYQLSDNTKIGLQAFGLVGSRKALGNIETPTKQDFPDNKRNLLSDEYKNFASELRVLHRYEAFGDIHALAFGARYFLGNTMQDQGDGPSGYSVDFNFYNDDRTEYLDYQYKNENVAFFAENIFNVTENLSITPGIRYEFIRTSADGIFKDIDFDLAQNPIKDSLIIENRNYPRGFLLAGIGASYKLDNDTELYGNFSQNYRAVTFNDIRISNPNLRIDPNLRDESGFNADLGIRGELKKLLNFDWSVFYLNYDDKISNYQETDSTNKIIRRVTNVDKAQILGFESYTELAISKLTPIDQDHFISVFTNFAYLYSRYSTSGPRSEEIDGNRVEFTPEINLQTGLNYDYKNFSSTLQFGYVSSQYSEASNAGVDQVPTGIDGEIPAYYVMDLSCKYKYKFAQFEAGINNLTDNIYFTRRSTGYPGPGILPSPGRNFYFTLGLKF